MATLCVPLVEGRTTCHLEDRLGNCAVQVNVLLVVDHWCQVLLLSMATFVPLEDGGLSGEHHCHHVHGHAGSCYDCSSLLNVCQLHIVSRETDLLQSIIPQHAVRNSIRSSVYIGIASFMGKVALPEQPTFEWHSE